ncbi:MAG: pyridoxine 5'-phosphate synthase [Candidatus Porifericomitaceae bacterium WSBS_2022_MAG_OTU9]
MKYLALGVNIDHVATLRQARGGCSPDILEAAQEAIAGGADAITVHLREDRRHIQDQDIFRLRNNLKAPLNLEMSTTGEIVDIVESLAPAYVCLVPERRSERTTESGLDVCRHKEKIADICKRMSKVGSRVSLFIDPLPKQIEAAVEVGTAAVELHTGDYANANAAAKLEMLGKLQDAAAQAHDLGLLVHAGHGLDIDNVTAVAAIKHISELNIGYSIICRSLLCGIRCAVAEMKNCIQLSAAQR